MSFMCIFNKNLYGFQNVLLTFFPLRMRNRALLIIKYDWSMDLSPAFGFQSPSHVTLVMQAHHRSINVLSIHK